MSIIRLPGERLRIAFNRDELLTRPAALPPRQLSITGGNALMPIDPQSQGTWIAVNDAGLVLSLLNVNLPGGANGPGKVSRGRLIPKLLHARSVSEAIDASASLPIFDFGPFQLVAIDRSNCGHVLYDGRDSHIAFAPIESPLLYTSSGLGDELVERPRRELFEQIISTTTPLWTAQDEFHRHRWPDKPHLSVNMTRSDAMTVSHTLVELDARRASMTYHPGPPDVAADDVTMKLELSEAERA